MGWLGRTLGDVSKQFFATVAVGELWLTFRAQVLGSLQIVHLFKRFCLLLGELLLIIVLSRACYAVEEHAALLCVAEVVDNSEDEEAEACSTEY